MPRFRITLDPRGSVSVGGYNALRRSTAHDAHGLLIPGSTLKGALRESAVRILRGAGHDERLADSLFGSREFERAKLRVGPLRASDRSAQPMTRSRIGLNRTNRASASCEPCVREVAPPGSSITFEGILELDFQVTKDELALLRSAVAITDQLGWGRGGGHGFVALGLNGPLPERDSLGGLDFLGEFGTWYMVLEAEEPLLLRDRGGGGGEELSNEEISGSVVRGAVAAVLNKVLPDRNRKAKLEDLLGGCNPAHFGSARAGRDGVPAPRTLDHLGRDHAVGLTLSALSGDPRTAPLRSAAGTWRREGDQWVRVHLAHRRIHRAPRNWLDGRAEANLVHSLSVIDPFEISASDNPKPLRFWVPIRGSAEQIKMALEAASHGLTVGGSRRRGLGKLRLVGVEPTTLPVVAERHGAWASALMGEGASSEDANATGSLLAIGFLAIDVERLEWSLHRAGLKLIGRAAYRRSAGGWNSGARLPRSLKKGFGAGSVFLVATKDGSSALRALSLVEQSGLGPGRPDGWGEMVACHPIHFECCSRSSL